MLKTLLIRLHLVVICVCSLGLGCEARQETSPKGAAVSPIKLPNGTLWHGLTDPPAQTTFRQDHPRILVTPEGIDDLKAKLKHPAYAKDVAFLQSSNNGTDQAFCYLLWGDQQKGREAVKSLLDWSFPEWQAMERATKQLQGVLMYDWLHKLMSPEEREQASELLMARIPAGPQLRYFHSDHLTDHTYTHLLMALALDNEWAQSHRKKLLDADFRGFKVYRGILDVLTASSLQNGGTWHAGCHAHILDGYETGYTAIGGPHVLRAWETATGQSLFNQTTYFERLPYDVACSRMYIQPSLGRRGKIALELCTGLNHGDAAGLSQWLLEKYGRLDNDYGRVSRLIMGDRRVASKSPQELNIPLHGFQDGANCVYVRSSWDESATNFLFFARHWDRGRYEQESSQLVVTKNGAMPLPLATEAKGVAHNAFTALRVFPRGSSDKRQGNTYWRELLGEVSRAEVPEDVADPVDVSHRPETLTQFSESGGIVTATTRFEKLLKVSVPLAQRTVVIDPHAETVQIRDRVELTSEAEAEIWFGLNKEPVIRGNIIENELVKLTVESDYDSIRWDAEKREVNHRGNMWIVGTLKVKPKIVDGRLDSTILVEVK